MKSPRLFANRAFWWLPAVLLMVALWQLSSIPQSSGFSPLHPIGGLLNLLSAAALAYSLGRATGQPRLGLVLAVWWSAGLEMHQAFIPGRDAGIGDWLYSLIGALLGGRLTRGRRPQAAPANAPLPEQVYFEQRDAA